MPDFSLYHFRESVINLENIILHVLTAHLGKASEQNVAADRDFQLLQTRHVHVCAELFVCTKGEILIDSQFSVVLLKEGDAALVPPGIVHYKVPNDKSSEYIAIQFSCKHRNVSNVEDLYKKLLPFFSEKRIFEFRQSPDIAESAAEIVQAAREQNSLLPALKGAELMIQLAEYGVKGQNAAGRSRVTDSDYNRLSILESYINTSFMKSYSIKEAAEHLHLSTRQVDRIVRKHLGISFHQAIMEQRIRTAEKMLLTTDMTAERIGFSVGFSSLSGFYREFIRKHGVTPGEYRKENV